MRNINLILMSFALGILSYATTMGVVCYANDGFDAAVLVYQNNIRGYMFAAFLGASSFLISLLTFLVINIKEKMFDSVDYLRIYVSHKGLKEGDSILKKDLYSPLRSIGMLLVIAIFLSIISSVSQFTLGFSNKKLVLIVPTLAPFMAISFLIFALGQINSLIRHWLGSGTDTIKVSKDLL